MKYMIHVDPESFWNWQGGGLLGVIGNEMRAMPVKLSESRSSSALLFRCLKSSAVFAVFQSSKFSADATQHKLCYNIYCNEVLKIAGSFIVQFFLFKMFLRFTLFFPNQLNLLSLLPSNRSSPCVRVCVCEPIIPKALNLKRKRKEKWRTKQCLHQLKR